MYKVQFLFPSAMNPDDVETIIHDHVFSASVGAPGLQAITVNRDAIMGMKNAPYQAVAEVTFETLDHAMAVARSERAQAGEAKFAEHGIVLMVYEAEVLADAAE